MAPWAFFKTLTKSYTAVAANRGIIKLTISSFVRPSQQTFSTLLGPNSVGAVPQTVIDQFQEDGVVCIRNYFDENWQHIAHKGIEYCFRNPSEYCDWIVGEDGDGIYYNDYLNWEKVEELKRYAFHSPAAVIAGQLMKSSVSIFFHEHVFVKKGGKNRAAPWHHDQAYYPIDGMQNCTIWMPTTPVSKETCLQFVKGSHLWGKWFYPKKFVSHANYPIESDDGFHFDYEDIPDVDGSDFEILSWDLQPGDCIAFHMKTLHATTKSSAVVPRYVLATRWLGDDATYARRPWKSSPPPEILPKDLQLGEKISESKGFPVIWRKDVK